jgi:hypothetical protein
VPHLYRPRPPQTAQSNASLRLNRTHPRRKRQLFGLLGIGLKDNQHVTHLKSPYAIATSVTSAIRNAIICPDSFSNPQKIDLTHSAKNKVQKAGAFFRALKSDG